MQGELRRLQRGPLLLLQEVALDLVGRIGRHRLEEPAAEDLQLPRSEHRRLADEVRLRLRQERCSRPSGVVARNDLGQGVQRVDDHPRVVDADPAVVERSAHGRIAVQDAAAQPLVADVATRVVRVGVGQPVRRRPGTGALRDVVGPGQHPDDPGLDPVARTQQLAEVLRLGVGRQEVGIEALGLVQRPVQRGHTGQQRVLRGRRLRRVHAAQASPYHRHPTRHARTTCGVRRPPGALWTPAGAQPPGRPSAANQVSAGSTKVLVIQTDAM
ncbi:hypothetical protein [Nocardioides sp. SYSU DS0651]|uniref:hypothetical protein n=1 Tax=Nocardioides sp. SYSU DS0651 TaxID=3415955 RepID=UPI003F4C1987